MNNRLIIADIKSNNNNGICTGHYYAFAANYQNIFRTRCEVKIASGPIYRKKFKGEDMIMLPCDYIVGDSKFKNIIRMLHNGWNLFALTKKDDVIILQQSQPAMILFTLLLTCFGRRNIYQVQYSSEPMRRFYYRIMFYLKRKYFKGILCPNDEVGRAYGIPYLVLPDYIYIGTYASDWLSYDSKKYDFCSVGRITGGKGISETVSVMAGKPYSMIIAGQAQDTKEESTIKKYIMGCSNIDLKMKYITDDKYKEYISSSRYSILNYQEEYSDHSSGVVFDFLFNGVPVIARRCKSLQFIEDNHLGLLYDNIQDVDFSSLLNNDFYVGYINSIKNYCDSFRKHINNLTEFLEI